VDHIVVVEQRVRQVVEWGDLVRRAGHDQDAFPTPESGVAEASGYEPILSGMNLPTEIFAWSEKQPQSAPVT